MMPENIKISDYYYLKSEYPTFEYDVATYCHGLNNIVGNYLPEYLSDFKSKLSSFASQKKLVRPSKFSNAIRIYIFDQRLNIPLFIEDSTGDIANYCSQLAKNCKSYDEYSFGDGDKFNVRDYYGNINKPLLKSFVKDYDFVPLEELGNPTLAIFFKSKLEERRFIPTWLTYFLLMKYNHLNLIDWASTLDDLYYRFDPIVPDASETL